MAVTEEEINHCTVGLAYDTDLKGFGTLSKDKTLQGSINKQLVYVEEDNHS